jgi:hypothetical protein
VSAAVAAAEGMKRLDIMIAIMRRYYSEEMFDKALEAAKALAPYFSQKFAPTDQPTVPHLELRLPLFANQPNAGRSARGKRNLPSSTPSAPAREPNGAMTFAGSTLASSQCLLSAPRAHPKPLSLPSRVIGGLISRSAI